VQKLSGTEEKFADEKLSSECKRVSHLLSHLPFVSQQGSETVSEVRLINPKSISESILKDGAAQCFLVISQSNVNLGENADGKETPPVKLLLESIRTFVHESQYGS